MNDIQILENLFNNKNDKIAFKNLEESNIISVNDNNKGDYSNNKLLFNTLQISKISTPNFVTDNTTTHEITFKFPIFLKDINKFFRKIDIINFGEFNIQMTYKALFIFKRNNSTINIISAYLYVNEIKLSDSDNIKLLKMLNSGYSRKINFLENNVKEFTYI